MSRILTGIQATGTPHLGNLLGAIIPAIELSKKELKQIKSNKSSNDIVSICSGCTDWNKLTIQELFQSDRNFLKDQTERWLKEMIK